MEGKKISFGFMKTKKVEKAVAEEKKDFIECMEEKSIKIVGGEEVKETAPLVIPMKPNTLVTAERLKQIADEVENALNEPDDQNKPTCPVPLIKIENESLDQMVVRELLEDTKKDVKIGTTELTLPVSKKSSVEVQKEATLEDYEDVPIQEFGLAMLRGMGWTPGKEQAKYKQPQLRPKGLGLGADKVVTDKQKKVSVNERGDELTIVKNSFVKITTGKYNGYYGKVVSLDEDNGRVMVDITIKKETVSLSEFMMQPVTAAEFNKESKVINADSFEEYKRSEKLSQNSSDHYSAKSQGEASSSKPSQDLSVKDYRVDKAKSNNSSQSVDGNSTGVHSREKSRRDSSSSEKSHRRKKNKKRHSSYDSLSSLSESDKKHKHKSSRRRYSSDSDSDSPKREKRKRTPVKKRDIDKKRKGKKKKRDRDRSPHHYKKHRK